MPNKIEIEGKKFGRLLAIKEIKSGSRKKKAIWLCKCDCGKETEVSKSQLLSGRTKSCGCLRKESTSKMRKRHGLSKSRLYNIWLRMKQCCYNKSSHKFKIYGGRGIKICEEWKNSFENFYKWSIPSGYKQNLTIDRIDVNGNYFPENCRWILSNEQNWNRRNTVYITINNEKMNLKQAEEKFGINHKKIYDRLQKGWCPERAILL